jgi:hypothetical protein
MKQDVRRGWRRSSSPASWLAAGLSGAILFLAFAGVAALSRRLGRR